LTGNWEETRKKDEASGYKIYRMGEPFLMHQREMTKERDNGVTAGRYSDDVDGRAEGM